MQEVAGERHLSELSGFMVQQARCPRRVGGTEKVLPFAARISPSDGTPSRWPSLAASRCSIRRASLVSTERGMGDCLSRY